MFWVDGLTWISDLPLRYLNRRSGIGVGGLTWIPDLLLRYLDSRSGIGVGDLLTSYEVWTRSSLPLVSILQVYRILEIITMAKIVEDWFASGRGLQEWYVNLQLSGGTTYSVCPQGGGMVGTVIVANWIPPFVLPTPNHFMVKREYILMSLIADWVAIEPKKLTFCVLGFFPQ